MDDSKRRTRRRAAESKEMLGPERPRVDFLILADRAEAINGKLYLMGGAWDRIKVIDFQKPVSFFVALGAVVPWTAANEQISIEITLRSEDGILIEQPMQVGVIVGRPPLAKPGQSFRATVAAGGSFTLPKEGAYELSAHIYGSDPVRTVFYAEPAQPVLPFQTAA